MTLKEMMQDEYEQGVEKTIISLICKKLPKGKSISVIASEIEETTEKVQIICDIAKDFAPDYDVDAIYKKYAEVKEK